MNFELSEDQASVLSSLDQLLNAYTAPPVDPVILSYSPALASALAESGFLGIASVDGFGPLDAALVVERVARVPHVVETGVSALVRPVLGIELDGPIAISNQGALARTRFLPVAQAFILIDGDQVSIVRPKPNSVTSSETLLAYPYGYFTEAPIAEPIAADADAVRRRWRTAIACEAAGCMTAALDILLDHVKTRRAFGRPLGAFQAIQHRLATAAQTAEATRWLALRAAWSDENSDAAVAAGYAQSRIARFTYDLHQFSGAMGLTLEYPLHFYTYRLRGLAGELGGASAQSRAAAAGVWQDAA